MNNLTHEELERVAYITGDNQGAAMHATAIDALERIKQLEALVIQCAKDIDKLEELTSDIKLWSAIVKIQNNLWNGVPE